MRGRFIKEGAPELISTHAMRCLYLIVILACTASFAGAEENVPVAAASERTTPAAKPASAQAAPVAEPDDGSPQVRLVAMETDVAKRYLWTVPALPVPPFTRWRKW